MCFLVFFLIHYVFFRTISCLFPVCLSSCCLSVFFRSISCLFPVCLSSCCLSVCLCLCLSVSVCVCLSVRLSVRVSFLPSFLPFLPSFLPSCLPAFLPSCLPARLLLLPVPVPLPLPLLRALSLSLSLCVFLSFVRSFVLSFFLSLLSFFAFFLCFLSLLSFFTFFLSFFLSLLSFFLSLLSFFLSVSLSLSLSVLLADQARPSEGLKHSNNQLPTLMNSFETCRMPEFKQGAHVWFRLKIMSLPQKAMPPPFVSAPPFTSSWPRLLQASHVPHVSSAQQSRQLGPQIGTSSNTFNTWDLLSWSAGQLGSPRNEEVQEMRNSE